MLDPGELGKIPPHERYVIGVYSVINAEDNPEKTMQLAVTEKDLALIAFSSMVTGMMFPEVGRHVSKMSLKLMEVSDAQDFLPWEPGELDNLKREEDQ